MRYGFDIDGTLTNFSKFVLDNSIKYMKKKYNTDVVNINGYDIDEIFDLKNHFLNKGYTEKQAIDKTEKILKNFWEKYYPKYILTPFRKDVTKAINNLLKEGKEVFIISSRKKTADKDFKGILANKTTKFQLKILNGLKIKNNHIFLVSNDEEKVEVIRRLNLDVHFDDKSIIIEEVSKFTNVVVIRNGYNSNCEFSNNVQIINEYSDSNMKKIEKQLKENKKNSNYKEILYFKNLFKQKTKINKHLKKIFTETMYKIVRIVGLPFVYLIYKPKILNANNVYKKGPIVFAPNHLKTLDPFFIIATTKGHYIHWAALKRFFTANDSVFNNNKNLFLRKFTSILLKSIGAEPFERKRDTSNPDNIKSIEEMGNYLKLKGCIGIFPEETTNKNPDSVKLLDIKSGAIFFAKHANAWFQPIAISYDSNNLKRVIINYRPAIKLDKMNIKQAKDYWYKSVSEGIDENSELLETEKKLILK